MSKLGVFLGRLYVKAPWPMWVSVLLTLLVVGVVVNWLFL